ncbi:hypothetical protein JG688_00012516 [Phytophthora aleatoria]|uniref:Protein kinase domain-containing protein n=1 Tax=Phytophthora aleatoria TaxID=2496075 RepID=A0A8J5IB40_9STRA|nr:hypothetical protein JG688_00012516 [Phytophthora aleatoria]
MLSSGGPSEGTVPSNLHAATLEAFYSRVIQRVCSSYREQSELTTDEAIERLRQKWQEKLALYTGKHAHLREMTEGTSNDISVVESVESSRDSDGEASDEDGLSIPSSSSLPSSPSSPFSSSSSPPSFVELEAPSEQAIGRPSAQLASGTTSTSSSIFSKMLGAKRKLHQVDGSISDDEDAVEWQDDDFQEQQHIETRAAPLAASMQEAWVDEGDNADSDTEDEILQDVGEEKEEKEEELPSSFADSSASLLVSSEDFSPVSGLSGINLPLQLAAQYSKFIHRGNRRGYFGQLHSIVLTWPERGFLDEGEVVKVISLGDTLHELKVEGSNGTETTVQMHRVRRLKEFLIRKGSVRPYAIKKFVPQKSKGVPNRRAVPVATGTRPSTQASQPNAIPDDVRREVALLKKASNLPYVIRLHDVILDTENRDYYLVMEYMGGGVIAEWDGSRKCYVSSRAKSAASGSACLLDESTVRAYVTNLVLAIQGLHLNNLAHRDIKPENLMANEEHTLCKLGDLGVAHYFKEENGELHDEEDVDAIELWDINQGPVPSPATASSTGGSKNHLRGMIKSTKGTYQFLPPESLNGDAYCAFKADIWAIGVTMYALLFGSLPYYSNDVSELFDKIENDPLEFPVSCEDNDAKDLLRGILEKDPEKRITLEGILQHRWTHRNIDSKSLRKQVNALKQAPILSIEDHELGGAVSVHQSRFLKMAAAIRHDTLNDLATDGDIPSPQENGEYKPNPIDTKEMDLPQWFAPHHELVAAQMHYDWCRGKSLAGWKYGDVRDDAHLVHPLMLPMRALDDTARARNFASVDEIIKCVVALGVHVTYRRPPKLKTRSAPFPVDHVQLSWDVMILIDLLAENSHEVWATEYAAKGWRLGAKFDEDAKTHPSLKSYMLLDELDKTLTRESVTSVLKSCIYLGCKFLVSRKS